TYCASAHTVLGSQAGVSAGEAEINIEGRSEDPKTQAALQFARAVAISRGHIEDAAFDAVRAAGFTDGEIAEIVGHVALNTFTNIFNSVADTEVDFPRVEIPAGVSA
ncbi:MAG: carboxymuconolactone decarboxylase family protein, partial [Planctomycetota bacterium]